MYLGGEGVLVTAEGVALVTEGVVAGAEGGEVALDLLALPARAAVLKPDGDLARVEEEVACDAGLALGVQLVVRLEATLQRAHLLRGQPPRLLTESPRAAACPATGEIVVLFILLIVVCPHIALPCAVAVDL
jgi:hypothetical protein